MLTQISIVNSFTPLFEWNNTPFFTIVLLKIITYLNLFFLLLFSTDIRFICRLLQTKIVFKSLYMVAWWRSGIRLCSLKVLRAEEWPFYLRLAALNNCEWHFYHLWSDLIKKYVLCLLLVRLAGHRHSGSTKSIRSVSKQQAAMNFLF